MKVIIWGSRGSLPASLRAETIRQKIFKALEAAKEHDLNSFEDIDKFIDNKLAFNIQKSYGTNTSCVEIREEKDIIILDAGTGLRDFGNYIMRSGQYPCHFHIFMSHVHWDHIHGFPFFTPAFIKGNRIDFYGFHDNIKEIFINQQKQPCFPVPFDYLKAEIHFTKLEIGKEYLIAGYHIRGYEQNHPGKSYGYSFEKNDRKIVYSTDSEHILDSPKIFKPFIKFFSNCDLLIFDAQYSLMDAIQTKKYWGHSSNVVGLELAVQSGAKHYCMFHTEPTYTDEMLDTMLKETKAYASIYASSYPIKISVAYDGMEIDLS